MPVPGLGLTVAAVLALVPAGARRGPRHVTRLATVLVGAVLALGIGTSRAYPRVRRTTDVPAGLLDGALLSPALGCAALVAARAMEIHPSDGVPAAPLP